MCGTLFGPIIPFLVISLPTLFVPWFLLWSSCWLADLIFNPTAFFRVEKLEMLDEVNLFYQLLNHYCISWAFNDENGRGKIVSFVCFVFLLVIPAHRQILRIGLGQS